MATAAEIQTRIDTLEQSLIDRKGAVAVSFEDQTINFAPVESTLALIADLKPQLAAIGGSTTRYISTSKDV
jgi:hypothetical protein